MTLFKSMWKAVVLMGIAGVLGFAGMVSAQDIDVAQNPPNALSGLLKDKALPTGSGAIELVFTLSPSASETFVTTPGALTAAAFSPATGLPTGVNVSAPVLSGNDLVATVTLSGTPTTVQDATNLTWKAIGKELIDPEASADIVPTGNVSAKVGQIGSIVVAQNPPNALSGLLKDKALPTGSGAIELVFKLSPSASETFVTTPGALTAAAFTPATGLPTGVNVSAPVLSGNDLVATVTLSGTPTTVQNATNLTWKAIGKDLIDPEASADIVPTGNVSAKVGQIGSIVVAQNPPNALSGLLKDKALPTGSSAIKLVFTLSPSASETFVTTSGALSAAAFTPASGLPAGVIVSAPVLSGNDLVATVTLSGTPTTVQNATNLTWKAIGKDLIDPEASADIVPTGNVSATVAESYSVAFSVIGNGAVGTGVSATYGSPAVTLSTNGKVIDGTVITFKATAVTGFGVSWTATGGTIEKSTSPNIATLKVEGKDVAVTATYSKSGLVVELSGKLEDDYTGKTFAGLTVKVKDQTLTGSPDVTNGSTVFYRKSNNFSVASDKNRDDIDAGTVYVFATHNNSGKTNSGQVDGNSFKINPRALTLVEATASKTYDGDKTIKTPGSDVTITTIVGIQESETIGYTVSEAEYTSANALTNEIKVKRGEITGVQAKNYTVTLTKDGVTIPLVGTAGVNSGILKKKLVIDHAKHTKVYDGDVKAESVELKFVEGDAPGQVRSADRSKLGAQNVEAAYISKDAGTAMIKVTSAEFTGSGTAAGNYEITVTPAEEISVTEGSGTKVGIQKKVITIKVGGHEVETKTYDGTKSAKLLSVAFDGLVDGEDFKIGADVFGGSAVGNPDYAVTGATFRDINAGADKEISAGTVTLHNISGGVAKNYDLGTSSSAKSLAGKGATGTIEKKDLKEQFVTLGDGLSPTFNGTPTKTYTGAPVTLTTTGSKPNLTIADGTIVDGKDILVASRDYSITYSNNINAGKDALAIIEAKETGNYVTDEPIEVEFLIGRKEIEVKGGGHTVENRYYDGTTEAPVSAIAFKGLVAGDVLYISTEEEEGDYEVTNPVYASANAGNSKVVSGGSIKLLETDVANNYFLKGATGGVLSIGSAHKLSGNVLKQPLKVADIIVDTKVYDGSDSTKVSGVTFVDENDEEVDIPGNASNGYVVSGAKYEDATAGTDKLIVGGKVTLKGTTAGQTASNYAIVDANIGEKGFRGTIEKRNLVINDAASATVISKQYDGTAEIATENVALKFKTGVTGEGIVTKDAPLVATSYSIVGGRFDDATVANSKSVVSGTVVLEGSLADNYSLESASIGGFTGKITKRGITVSSATHTKVYDGNTSAAGLLFTVSADAFPGYSGDAVNEVDTVYTAVYTNKAAGTKTVKFTKLAFKSTAPAELKANYEIDLTKIVELASDGITKKPIAIAAVSHSKAYDGTVDAVLTATNALTFSGLVTGDASNTVVVDTAFGTYTAPTVGTKTLTLASIALKGTNGGNYSVEYDPTEVWTLAGTPAGILGRTLTIDSIVVSKTYDGVATVESDSVRVVFKNVAEVDVPFTSYSVKGLTFQNAAAGVGKTITGGTVELQGLALENYLFTAAAGNLAGKGYKADIRQKSIAIASVAHTKPYDGTKNAVGVAVTLDRSGFIGADTAITVGSVVAEYPSAMFGTKTLNVIRVNLTGTNATNYAVVVSSAPVTVEGITGTSVTGITVTGKDGVTTIQGKTTLQLSAAILPADATIKNVRWSVNDSTVAKVSAGGLLSPVKDGTVIVTASALDSSKVTGTLTVTVTGVAVAEVAREIPNTVVTEVVTVAPVKVVASGFTAGPSPVSLGGTIKFFSAKQVKSGSLYIFDAQGNAVAKLSAKSGSGEIGSWNLKAKNGASVSEGTYVVKGALVGKDGTREKVSFVFAVVK